MCWLLVLRGAPEDIGASHQCSHRPLRPSYFQPRRSEHAQDAFLRLWEQYDTHLNRKISTDTTLQIATFAHSDRREQQKSDDGRAHHRRGERSHACWDPPPAWGQQPQPFWASIPSQQPISHHHQVGPQASVGVVWKVILRSRLPRDQLARSELQLLPRHRLEPANGREAAGRRSSPCRAAAPGRS